MSELKPCPHCGEEPIEHAIEAHKHYLINLPDYPGSFVIECVCGAGSIGDTRDEAKAKWNRRAQPAQAGQVLTDEQLNNILDFHLEGGNWDDMARAIESAVLAKLAARDDTALIRQMLSVLVWEAGSAQSVWTDATRKAITAARKRLGEV